MTTKSQKNIKFILIILFIFFATFLSAYVIFLSFYKYVPIPAVPKPAPWEVKSIDTMKYSRDLARARANDPGFNSEIDLQMEQIASAGATYVAIATPYDPEFTPFLKRWVASAREHNLKIWFRGNLSGWEGWFGYPAITPSEHTSGIERFILNNSTLFADGDIFTSCTECENGRKFSFDNPASISAYQAFLAGEHNAARSAFGKIGRAVRANYYPMNYDVAQKVMDPRMTSEMDGIVVIDHYVLSPDKMAKDIVDLARKSGGKIVIGEFGAPVPDIHGAMTQSQQASWIKSVFENIAPLDDLVGVNYWVNKGGTTAIYNEDGTPRAAVSEIKKFFKSK